MLEHHAKGSVLLDNCIYCDASLAQASWLSENHKYVHYKSCICPDCGKTHTARVDFLGNGHDNWRRERWLTKEEVDGITNDFEQLMEKFQLNPNRRNG